MKKHILVVSQYFYPEQFRINDICSEWIKKGYKVTVLTGIPNYPKGKFFNGYGILKRRKEIYKGINIIRIPLIPRGNNSVMLILNYLSYVISGFFWQVFTKIDADFVYIYEVSPMTQALPGIWYAKKKKVPCYIYVTDLWPENVEIVTGLKNKYIIKLLGDMVDYIYSNCNKIFTSSKSFVSAINNRGISLERIKFWPQYAEDIYKPIKNEETSVKEIPQDNTFNIIFAGNIGEAQGLSVLPKTARILKEKKVNVRFNIVGDGRFKNTLIKMVKDYSVVDMFNFVDKQPVERIPEFMAVCDTALICLSRNKVFSMTIPAKTQSCLACGIPVLVSADGEIQDLITNAKAGICSEAGNEKMLATKIIELTSMEEIELEIMANNAINYSNSTFKKESLMNEMDFYFQ